MNPKMILTLLLLGHVVRAEPAIRRSDVVFMYDDPAMYEPYGCTVMGWAGHAAPGHIEEARAKGVRHFSASIGFLTEFHGVIDFGGDFLAGACRNFAGEPFIVPWLWDHKHKDHGAYWWCTNSPWYRKYLMHRLEKTMAAKPDGLHIDDYRGTSGAVTWLSACFCKHCLEGFRAYLKDSVPPAELEKLGIKDLSSFDYRRFLLDAGVKPEEYNQRRWSLPLAGAFLDFQVKANTAFVKSFHDEASRLLGRPASLSVNSGLSDPQALAIASRLGYFCCEVEHGAEKRRPPTHPIYIYKLGDALDRPVASTASGQDWAFTGEQNLPGLIRGWVALSYAFGHNLMAPHRQWCYTQDKGTHWKSWPKEEFAFLYRFVRENAKLFDGYEAVAPVAVIYDNAARRKGQANIEPICAALAEKNIPFTVAAAGDDWMENRLSAENLKPFKAVIVHRDRGMDAGQAAVIEQTREQGRLVTWPDDAALGKLLPPMLDFEGTTAIMAVPRERRGGEPAPAVIHLLNRAYDPEKDAWTPQKDIRLKIHRDLFAGRAFSKASLLQPGRDPETLSLEPGAEGVAVRIPECGLWGMLVLE